MEMQKSLSKLKPPLSSSPRYMKSPQKSAVSHSSGKYISRSSGLLQPPPLDLIELLRLVQELRDRESLLKTELHEYKLFKESLAIVPVLENEIYLKETEVERAIIQIEHLKVDNERLKTELEEVNRNAEEERRRSKKIMEVMEEEIMELKKTELDHRSTKPGEVEHYASQTSQTLVEFSVKSSLIRNLKQTKSINEILNEKKHERKVIDTKKGAETARPNYSECNSEEHAEALLYSQMSGHHSPTIQGSSSRLRFPLLSNFNSEHLLTPPLPPPVVSEKPMSQPPPPIFKSAPPPPPPPMIDKRSVLSKVRRVPEVVELYHSLMRRGSRKDCRSSVTDIPPTASARDMIGEIENRSTHLLAIKRDVETKGEFIMYLIKKVKNAAFTDIEDVVSFVKWLDDELSYLVDERAVLKHFEWPEQKADALREAAFGYSDLKKLEMEMSSFCDDGRQPRDTALKNMQALLDKLEYGVYNLSRMRESATVRYKMLNIPMDWMRDTGIVSQIKLQSLKLAVKYLKRISSELETVHSFSEEEQIIIHGIKFAFRVHQFAGGFDTETLGAFQKMREKIVSCQNRQRKIVGRSTAAD